jgi:hypothetical protein
MSDIHDESPSLTDPLLDFLNSLKGSEYDYAVTYKEWWTKNRHHPKIPEDVSLVRALKIRMTIRDI